MLVALRLRLQQQMAVAVLDAATRGTSYPCNVALRRSLAQMMDPQMLDCCTWNWWTAAPGKDGLLQNPDT